MLFDFRDILLFLEKNIWPLLLIGLILSNFATYFISKSLALEKSGSSDVVVTTTEEDAIPTTIAVDVSGAVRYPGLYSLPENSRISDALALSGGLTGVAAQRWILKNLNLSQKLKDSEKLYIPFEFDSDELCKKTTIQPLTRAESVEASASSAVIPANQVTPANQVADDKLNINTASQEELDTLPGIGSVLAARIIANRPYANLTELGSKAKLTQATLNKIQSLITF